MVSQRIASVFSSRVEGLTRMPKLPGSGQAKSLYHIQERLIQMAMLPSALVI